MGGSWRASEKFSQQTKKKTKKKLEQRTNAEEWRLEVERVAPSLKMTVKTDGR